jgi:hypothetical protein
MDSWMADAWGCSSIEAHTSDIHPWREGDSHRSSKRVYLL